MRDVNDVFNKLANRNNRKDGDYIDLESGLLMCGTCHQPKQKKQELPTGDGEKTIITVSVTCHCEQQEYDAEADRAKEQQFKTWMDEQQATYGIAGTNYGRFTFAADDRANPKISDTCQRYVAKWPEMRKNGMGMLFYGTVGTGKSFYACAIVNALTDKRIPAIVTSFPRLLNLLQSHPDRQGFIDALQRYDLLVIDDLGVERDSSYAAEQVFNVIDARANSGLPLIVTTNLTLDELKNPSSMQHKRIYDRIDEQCPIQIKMVGNSRRAGNAEARKAIARELLASV